MPKFAQLAEYVPCPVCGADLAYLGRVGFQWGYCEFPYSGRDPDGYHVGDPVVWRANARGRVPAWLYFADGTANIGDPREADLVVRESELSIVRCTACGHQCGGIGVVIRSGRIESVGTTPDWPSGIDVCVIGPSGALIPRPDWTDRPMRSESDDGSRVRLVANDEARLVADMA